MYEFLIPYFRLSPPLDSVTVLQGFGENATGFYSELGMLGHNGQDLRASHRTQARAVIDGTVTVAGEDYQGGREVRFVTDAKEVEVAGAKFRLEFVYYHLDSWLVKAGERVYRGQVIALTDNTGKYTTGPHLHFGMKVQRFENGRWIKDDDNGYFGAQDPKPFFTYMAQTHNPYNIAHHTLVQLGEGIGGFALFSKDNDGNDKFYIDDLAKILASWEVKNKGVTADKTLSVAQVVWDSYKPIMCNLKNQPLP